MERTMLPVSVAVAGALVLAATRMVAGEQSLGATPATATATGVLETPSDSGATMAGVTVESRRSVSVDGTFESLRDVIERLCAESGIVLRSYTAPDREVIAHYTGISLREALERLLSQESFVLGLTKTPGHERARITWLRVVASKPGGSRAGGSGRTSVMLPRSAFAGANVVVRRRAVQSFASKLQTDARFRNNFLATSDTALLQQLLGHPYAAEFLADLGAQMRQQQRLRAKISRLAARLSATR